MALGALPFLSLVPYASHATRCPCQPVPPCRKCPARRQTDQHLLDPAEAGHGTGSHLPWRSASGRHPRTAWWVLGRGMGLGGAEVSGRGARDARARSRGCSTRVLPGALHARTCRQRPLLTTKRAPTLLPAPSAGHVSACPWLFWAALATAWGGGSTEPRPLPCKAPRKTGCSLQGWKCPQQGPRRCPGWAESAGEGGTTGTAGPDQ